MDFTGDGSSEAGPPIYQPQSARGSAGLWLAIAAVVLKRRALVKPA
jgi:hypothetical protein